MSVPLAWIWLQEAGASSWAGLQRDKTGKIIKLPTTTMYLRTYRKGYSWWFQILWIIPAHLVWDKTIAWCLYGIWYLFFHLHESGSSQPWLLSATPPKVIWPMSKARRFAPNLQGSTSAIITAAVQPLKSHYHRPEVVITRNHRNPNSGSLDATALVPHS